MIVLSFIERGLAANPWQDPLLIPLFVILNEAKDLPILVLEYQSSTEGVRCDHATNIVDNRQVGLETRPYNRSAFNPVQPAWCTDPRP